MSKRLYAIHIPAVGYYISDERGKGFCTNLVHATYFSEDEIDAQQALLDDPSVCYVYVKDAN